ncbi:DNA double-strand break repair nuclease NurA [Thermoanaerobacterium sp. RBIITD]|uniref:DNA double-strand break repair nuclease NurA n=1 Tax=Thermoanaerobacterium sp. RBIITD TaxID=1550240 RepID=UPI000BB8ED34|nr:DNA double-strand break repair nuclease NurA [Thermoanaerobacterium sp. RBIITD]SNX55454.1 NurA domain-containing protein [Thermoanaerobacterium sp. RBIITD]
MLNSNKLLPMINSLIKNEKNLYSELIDDVKKALNEFNKIVGSEKELIKKIESSNTSWLTAIPLENLDNIRSVPKLSSDYSVLAVDGSQIMPDRHEIKLCYLINIGYVIFSYGRNSYAKMQSEPTLFFDDEDLFKDFNGIKMLITPKDITFKRTIMEYDKVVECIKEIKAGNKIAFIDGTLIEWMVQGDTNEQFIIKNILKAFDTALDLNTPIVGYISSPKSNDFINMLHISLCPQDIVNCNNCIYLKNDRDLPCSGITKINDVNIFSKILKDGERSPLFLSTSHILENYGKHKIAFFYLNIGSEVARIELPLWAANDANYLDLIHYICYDQAQKGKGYPISLQEAHEQAVVTGSERDMFYNMLSNICIKNGIKVSRSYKSQRKRSGIL